MVNESDETIQTFSQNSFRKFNQSIHQSQLDRLAEVTTTQSQNKIWSLQRAGVATNL